MSLELIIGGMFSGKTSETIRRLKRYKIIGEKILVINSSFDTRSAKSELLTHDGCTFSCIKTNVLDYELVGDNTVISIDEAQFFTGLVDFVKKCLMNNKKVLVTGLDGDFNQNVFGEILYLIPLCDDVIKMKALCVDCHNGTLGPFSKRITRDTCQRLIGHSDAYKAVCRRHLCQTLIHL
jgi:thymidine kinase